MWCLVIRWKLHPALIECSISELRRFGCRIFDIRRTAERMSKIRHPKKGASDVEYSTLDERLNECRKSDIRRRALRMSNRIRLRGRSNRKNPIQQIRRIESNLLHSIRQNGYVWCMYALRVRRPVTHSYGRRGKPNISAPHISNKYPLEKDGTNPVPNTNWSSGVCWKVLVKC